MAVAAWRTVRVAVQRPAPRCGFTLIELLTVLAILALLLLLGLPGYQASMHKGRRAEAIAALLEAAVRQEQHFLDHASYTTDMRALGFGSDPAIADSGNYQIAAHSCPERAIAACFALTATPVPGSAQAGDLRCSSFTLDALGRRSATGTDVAGCW